MMWRAFWLGVEIGFLDALVVCLSHFMKGFTATLGVLGALKIWHLLP